LDFLDARPAFQLLFAGYRYFDVLEAFVVDEPLDVVERGEAVGEEFFFVLADVFPVWK
jgi:hypothetical protein